MDCCYFGGGMGWIPQDCCSRMLVWRVEMDCCYFGCEYGVDSVGLLLLRMRVRPYAQPLSRPPGPRAHRAPWAHGALGPHGPMGP